MAEAVIIGIAEEIVANLVPQAIGQVGMLWGVKDEFKALRSTVSTLQAVLDDAEEQYYQNRQIRVWLEKLKDAFYEAQDVLEEFTMEATRRELRGHNEMIKEVRTFFSSSNQLAFKLKMIYKVRAVRVKIEAIKADKGIHLNERPMDPQIEQERRKKRETHSFIPKGDVIGRDDDKKAVMEFLLDLDVKENVSILPIVGIGGLGKTALAQCVYNDEMVSKHFHLKMWVCVSNDFDVNKIVKTIIACATNEEPTEVAIELLQRKLRATIDGKRYLLVLDDLWNEEPEKWASLKILLVGGARGSKILITTRLPSVAKITGTAPPHLLGALSDAVSLDLLMQTACRKEKERQDPEMLAIAEEIIKKCFGVPLVVRTVGSLLFFKKTKLEWLTFKDHELPDVSQKEDNIISILRLSYDYLPSHLKQCFAFCSLFPKDYEIKKQTLVNLWVAEGFIQPSNRNQHLEDIAHGYFMDLLRSNFFQDFHEDKETCKMHDLMHDLACSVAGTECWVAWDDEESISERTRHISYGSTFNLMGELPISCLKASALRTFLASPWGMGPMSKAYLRQLIQSFKRLRVLDLHQTNILKVPRSICKLKYLTYLDLSGSDNLKRLPNSITRLQNLKTLNLHGCRALEELPKGIRKLVSLRNLDIDDCEKLSYMPRGLGQLSSLHRLTRFILPKNKAFAHNYCRLGELNGLNNILGSLCIENLESVTNVVAESEAANLMGKYFLESLELKWGYVNIDDVAIGDRDETLLGGLQPHSNLQKLKIDGYKGENFPRWMRYSLVSSLPNLIKIGLWHCKRCKHLPPLGQLPHLKSLVIWDLPELEDIESCHSFISTASFPSLLELEIIQCEKLKSMPLAPHLEVLSLNWAHPALINMIVGLNKLKSLVICDMEFLECLAEECWKSLAALESLIVQNCPRLTSVSTPTPTPPPPPPPLGRGHQSNLVDLDFSDSEELDLSQKYDESSGGNILDSHGGLQNLRSVDLSYLPKLASLPPWLLQASNLEHLTIEVCSELDLCKDESGNLLILDSHGGLQNLRSVRLEELPKLASLPPWLLQASNLERLTIQACSELDLCKDESGNLLILDSHGGLQNLRSVRLRKLPKLESLPPWLLQLSNLEDLTIEVCSELDLCKDESGNLLILDSHGGLQDLRSVYLTKLPKLASLPPWLLQASNLEHLTIRACSELDLCKDESGNNIILDFHGGLQNLRYVFLEELPKLESLPQWLLQLSNLEYLEIGYCDNLKALPEQIEALQSLQELEICNCPSLTSLPEGMRRLASLTYLRIIGCPHLEERCKRDGGEDWYKIAHIPDIDFF